MRRLLIFILFCCFFWLPGCNNTNKTPSDAQIENISAQVKKLGHQMIKIWNNKEYDQYYDFYSQNVPLTYVQNGNIVRSREGLEVFTEDYLKEYPQSRMESKEMIVDVINSKLAIVTHVLQWYGTNVAKEELETEMILTTVFRKGEDGWLIVLAVESFPEEF